ncbi:hypothetical protein ACFLZ2_03810 [Candidatus Margulisiibacteriota bacterium]
MKKLLSIFLIVLFSVSIAYANSRIIGQVDELYRGRENIAGVKNAVTIIKTELADDPFNYDLLWRLSRFYYWMGETAAKKDEKLAFYEQGELYAEKAIAAKEDGVQGHLYKGIHMGRIGEIKGILKSLAMVDPIRLEMEIVLQYEPESANAHHVLAELYRKAPGWPLSIGNRDKALEEAHLAIKYMPDYTHTHLGLAELYIDMDKKEMAREKLQHIIDMELPLDYIPEGREDKVKASELLNKIRK